MLLLRNRFVFLIAIICVVSFSTTVGNSNYFALASHPLQVMTTTDTVGTIFSTSLSQSQQLINGPFTVLATTGTNLPCEFWTFNFTGNMGQYVSGNFTSDIPVSFYIVQNTTYQNWSKQGTCGSATEAIASQLLNTSYTFIVALPSSGTWVLVLVNSSNLRNAGGSIVAYLSSGGYTTTELLLATMKTTVPFTTVSSGNTLPASTNIPGYPPESIVIGIAFGLLAVLILRLRRRN